MSPDDGIAVELYIACRVTLVFFSAIWKPYRGRRCDGGLFLLGTFVLFFVSVVWVQGGGLWWDAFVQFVVVVVFFQGVIEIQDEEERGCGEESEQHAPLGRHPAPSTPESRISVAPESPIMLVTKDGSRATRSLVAFKPETLQRFLLGRIITRLENKGLKLAALKMCKPNLKFAQKHYQEHKDKDFFNIACAHLSSGPVIASVWEGRAVVPAVRALLGPTEPLEASVGTIRGDFGVHWRRNLVHASASDADAEREIALWFREEELVDWEISLGGWLYELPEEDTNQSIKPSDGRNLKA